MKKMLVVSAAFAAALSLSAGVSAQGAGNGPGGGQGGGNGRGSGAPGAGKEEPKKANEADSAGEWTQPKIDKLPAHDKKAADALKKVLDEITSARAKGMKKFAADATLKAEMPAMPGMPGGRGGQGGGGGMEMKEDLKVSWVKGEAVRQNIVTPEVDAEGAPPWAGRTKEMLRANAAKFAQLFDLLLGFESFADRFKDKVIVAERKADKLQEYRVWHKVGEEFVSEQYTVTDGKLSRWRDAKADRLYTWVKKDGGLFIETYKVTEAAAPSPIPGAPAGPTSSEFTFDTRTKVESYTVTAKASFVYVVPNFGMKINVVYELSKLFADDKVTKAMIDASTDTDAEPKKEEPKKDSAAKEEPKKDGASGASKDAAKKADGEKAPEKKDPAK